MQLALRAMADYAYSTLSDVAKIKSEQKLNVLKAIIDEEKGSDMMAICRYFFGHA
ncbi:hypothetical protein W822_17365 [Advenella kashmirensis W13003]|uniref:Uncharacterized protein n=2 Tax=Advenella kashmirensis TaxID=310575 RepID=V8QP09_9BURK|nr:hypothetical protein W822_17365 [Advenella kashmirensis W13003]